jgi:predicted RNA binding protein YcfA (HicA-like mRNA interferase family)
MAKTQRVALEFNSRKLLKLLKDDGWVVKRTNGDHVIMAKPSVRNPVVLVHPKKDLPIGLVRRIYKDAGWPT